jgi:MFS family permease
MVISVAEGRGESAPRNVLKAVRWLGSFLPEEKLSRGFWIFFTAAFFFDLGFGLYFFLFNLFLANSHFNEKFLGLATGALTLGNVAGTIPIGLAVRRYGLRPVLLFCFVAAPCIGIVRALVLWPPGQIGLSFLCGVALSCWPVCFAPTVARLTTEKNRVSAFSIVFATGIGTGTLAGLVGGYLPGMLVGAAGGEKHLAEGMRLVLLFACGFVMLGIWSILKLEVSSARETDKPRIRIFHPFLYRFLPAFALWSVVTGSFVPFAAVFLQQHLGIPMRHVGLIFAGSQLTQFAAVLLAPIVYRKWGTITGIMCTQIATGIAVFALSHARGTPMAIGFYLCYMGAQFMSGPGLYSLLMTRVPDAERSTASAVQNIAGALCQAASAAITGSCLVRFGYPAVLSGNAVVAIAASLMLFALLSTRGQENAGREPIAKSA